MGGARDCGFDELKKLEGEGSAQQIVLLSVEGALDFLPRRGGASLLEAGERGEALAGMLDESLTHFVGELAPPGDECGGILAIADAQLFVDHGGEGTAELMEAGGAGGRGDGVAEAAARGLRDGHAEELLFEMGDVDGHGVRCSLLQSRTSKGRMRQREEGESIVGCRSGTRMGRGNESWLGDSETG